LFCTILATSSTKSRNSRNIVLQTSFVIILGENPTLSQIEPYRDVVLFNLIFQSKIWLNQNIHLPNKDQINGPLLLSSKFCILISSFSSNFISFPSDLNSLLDLEWAKYMASAVLLVLQEHTVFFGKFKISSEVKSPSNKCFFGLLLFRFSHRCSTSVRTTRAWQWTLKDANEMVWSLLAGS